MEIAIFLLLCLVVVLEVILIIASINTRKTYQKFMEQDEILNKNFERFIKQSDTTTSTSLQIFDKDAVMEEINPLAGDFDGDIIKQ